MAGKYIEFVNPGYSTLYTRDLKYKPNTDTTYGSEEGENVFDPDSTNPLVEGEWLCYTADNQLQRFGTESKGAGKNVSTKPCALHFQEKGRYDAQITKKAHVVSGPAGFDFKCKLCVVDGSAVAGDRLFVADVAVGSVYKKGLVDLASMNGTNDLADGTDIDGSYFWSPGYIQRVISTSEIVVHYEPQLILVKRT